MQKMDYKPSKVIENFINGSLMDRVSGAFIYGVDRMGLSETEVKRMDHVAIALEVIDQVNGNQNLAIKKLMNHPVTGCSYTQAYNLIKDAEFVFPYIRDFNYLFRLLIKEQRLEKTIQEAIDKKEFKALAKLEEIHLKVIQEIEIVRLKKKKPEKITIHLHMDMTRLGISPELYQDWMRELKEEIIPSVKRKYKGYDIADAEFEELNQG